MTGAAGHPERAAAAGGPPVRLDPLPGRFAAPRTLAVLDALAAAGGEARFVGGCVRDAIVGVPIGDIDIATTLTPDAVTAALRAAGHRAVPTGIGHGTVTAVVDGEAFEITTLRRDVGTDGRHATVAFTTDWRADAARRDFTMNALYADRGGRVFDPVGDGVADARAGRVRFVGDAATRLREDYLRLLRFFRFFAHYGREAPDRTTLDALAAHAGGLARLSGERVRRELARLLEVPDPVPAWRLMAATGVAEAAIGEAGDADRLAGLTAVEPEPDWLRRLAAVMTAGPRDARAHAERLRLSGAERERLVALRTPPPEPLPEDADGAALRRWLYRQGAAAGRDRLLLMLAGAGPADPRRRLIGDALAFEPPALPVTGTDALDLGAAPGPALGEALRAVECWWVDRDFAPDRAACRAELARRLAAGRR